MNIIEKKQEELIKKGKFNDAIKLAELSGFGILIDYKWLYNFFEDLLIRRNPLYPQGTSYNIWDGIRRIVDSANKLGVRFNKKSIEKAISKAWAEKNFYEVWILVWATSKLTKTYHIKVAKEKIPESGGGMIKKLSLVDSNEYIFLGLYSQNNSYWFEPSDSPSDSYLIE